jgi:gliding motility-associated lipoprotein GldH
MAIKIKHKYYFILFFTVLLLSSCSDKSMIWQQKMIITDCRWNKDTVLKFDIPVGDTVELYSLSIYVRNRLDYSFQNLYLFLNIKAPNENTTSDTLSFDLAYDDGKWKGSGGLFSKYRENIFLYREYILFPEKGNYSVNIRHGMRKDDLEGIASIGLILKHIKKINN